MARSAPAPLPCRPDGRQAFRDLPEAAEVLRTDARTLRKALEAGKVPGTKVGGPLARPRPRGCVSRPAQGTAAA